MRTPLVAGLVAAAVTLGAGGVAYAAETSDPSTSTVTSVPSSVPSATTAPGAHAARCERLNTLITVKAPTVEAKIDAAKAKLQQAIDTATSKGNTVRADRLRTRLTKLDGKEATLQAKLTAAKDLYAARGCTPTS